MIQVLVVDKVRVMGEVIAATLMDEADMHVAGIATDIDEALAFVKKSKCNLVLISTTSGEGEALELTSCIKQDHSDIKTLIIGMPDSEAIILRFIETGASGYLLTEDPLETLHRNIRAIFENEAHVSPDVAAALIERVSQLSSQVAEMGIDPTAFGELTPREKEILELIADGSSNSEIAQKLTVEVGTVKNHVHNILSKLSVNSRRDAAAYFALLQQELVTDTPC